MKVLHFPSNTGNHPAGLVAAERRAGVDSELVTVEASPFYNGSIDHCLDLGGAPIFVRWFKRLCFAASASADYDAFHFNKGETFLPGSLPVAVDLWWLKRKGKSITVTFQGSDARPHVAGAPRTRGLPPATTDLIKRLRVRQICRWADDIYCLNPDLLEHVPAGKYLPYASVDPNLVSPSAPSPSTPAPRPNPLRVVHAPSNRALKGTAAVLAAVEEVSKDLEIELDLVENCDHASAMERYRAADIAIDQLSLGWYGGLAVECMALGMPTIAYLAPHQKSVIDPEMASDLPIVEASIDNLSEVLVTLATTTDLADLGRRSRAFVERWHNPDRIAQRVLKSLIESR